jgi:hypothetical protein
MEKPSLWFLMPSADFPTGGVNNCYRLCLLAEELGIKAGVISDSPYPFCDPADNSRFWRPTVRWAHPQSRFDIPEVQEGDLVIQAELYHGRFTFSKKVRRIIFAQNWSLLHKWGGWQEQIWTYNNWVHLTYCIETFGYTDYINIEHVNSRQVDVADTQAMHDKRKVRWSCVSAYFDFDKFTPGVNDPGKVLFMPRKLGTHADKFQRALGDKLVIVDGVTPDELRRMYSEVGILLLPSASEGLAFPMIEAIASGCCVVGWECGGPEEYLINGETGMLSKFGDFDSLLENTLYLLDNPTKQRELSIKGREVVMSLFNKDKARMELYLAYHSSIRVDPS